MQDLCLLKLKLTGAGKLKTNKASRPGTRVIDDTADKFNYIYIKIWKRV
jgi:hypothetical protein